MIDYNIIATGSKGNAVVIDQKILIDCGVSFKALSKVYRALKLVLLTHIHSDHFQPTTLRLLAENRPTLRFACCAWLCKPLVDAGVPVSQIDVLEPGHMYGYGICNVRPDMVKHNVPNCAWKVWLPSGKLFYCTDMNNLNGITAPNYDLYMVEANYDDAEIQAKIAEKKLNGEYIYELGVLHNHMSLAKINDWLYANMGQNSAYIYMHCHQDKEDANGHRPTDWLTFTAWGKTAEFVSKYFRKGSAAVVHSRCQTRQYEDKNGNNRTAIEFVVDNIYFAGPKQDNQQGAVDDGGTNPPQATYRNQQPQQMGFATQSQRQQWQGAADHPGNVQVSQSFSQGSDDDFSVLDDADDLPF